MASVILPTPRSNALIIAAYKGHEAIAKLLIGAMRPEDLKIQNNNGATALSLASGKGYTDIVQLLQEAMRGREAKSEGVQLGQKEKSSEGKISKKQKKKKKTGVKN